MDYQRIHDEIVDAARSRGWTKKTAPVYTESHHVIPKAQGGSDEPENLITITGREHFILHKLLYKINPNQENSYAFVALARFHRADRVEKSDLEVKARDVEAARIASAKLASERLKTGVLTKSGAENHNNYCLWVTPFGTFESVYEAAKATGIAKTTLYGRCMQPDKIITAPRLGRAMMGKTWRELGYDYIVTKDKHTKEKK